MRPDARQLVRLHLAWMATVNYSQTSVATRERYLGLFLAWCATREVTDLELVTPAVIERYQKHLFHYRNERTSRGLSFRSQRYHLSHLREFLRWCVRRQSLPTNPAADRKRQMPLLSRQVLPVI